MRNIAIREIKGITDCRVLTWSGRPIHYVVKASQTPVPNCLYFCSGNEREASLLKRMIQCDASGVVVAAPSRFHKAKWKRAGIGVVEVGNRIRFQIELAKIYRTKFDIPLIQVIGSAGKTTTKNMIGSVLCAGMPALVGYANYNTAFGVASNILRLRDTHKAAVVEAGMKSVGYMRFSSSIIKPQIAVLTSIQRAHYVTLGSIEKITEAKAEVLEYLDKNGALIINGDDPNCENFPTDRYSGRILRYGFSDECDLWASDIVYQDFKTYFHVTGRGIGMDCVIHTVGKYNVANALAAVLVGLELGMNPKEIRKGLAEFRPMARRLKISRGPYDTILIDDNFNANPDSTALLLQDIPNFTQHRPVMLVMGDVERPDEKIRPYAEKVHFELGRQMARIPFVKLIAIGKWAKEYVNGARSEGVDKSRMAYFETVKGAESYFKSSFSPGNVIIFKASVYVSVRDLIKSLDDL